MTKRSKRSIHWKCFTFAANSQAETCSIIKMHFYPVKLIRRMVSYIPQEIFWLMTPCQGCQEKVEFWIIEEAVNSRFWWSYFIINCDCQFTFCGEVTLSSTPHEWTTLVTLHLYKYNVAAKHGSLKPSIDQWVVTSRIAN